jgi:hypothetical protein
VDDCCKRAPRRARFFIIAALTGKVDTLLVTATVEGRGLAFGNEALLAPRGVGLATAAARLAAGSPGFQQKAPVPSRGGPGPPGRWSIFGQDLWAQLQSCDAFMALAHLTCCPFASGCPAASCATGNTAAAAGWRCGCDCDCLK